MSLPATDTCCKPLLAGALAEDESLAMASVLRALADPVRLRVVSIIAAAASGEVCACAFPELLGRSQPTMSHHLGQLVRAGILEREQRGRWAWFRLRSERLDDVAKALSSSSVPSREAVSPASANRAARPVRPDQAETRVPEPSHGLPGASAG